MMLLFALILTVAGAATALAQDDAEVRKELEAQYTKLAEAHDRRDLKAIASLKTADFHAIFPDGRVGDVKTMAQYTKQFVENNQPPFNIRNTIQQLIVSENRLIAVAEVFQEVSRTRDLAGAGAVVHQRARGRISNRIRVSRTRVDRIQLSVAQVALHPSSPGGLGNLLVVGAGNRHIGHHGVPQSGGCGPDLHGTDVFLRRRPGPLAAHQGITSAGSRA